MADINKHYESEFKKQMVRLVLEEGRTVASVNKDYNLGDGTVRGWIRQFNEECEMNHMNILLTGFRGTSSEVIVKTSKYKSLILPNDKVLDSRLLIEEMSLNKYNYILSFGQKPNIKNKVFIETTARNLDDCINTNFDYNKLKNGLETQSLSVKISGNAGTSFCNALYYGGLKFINNERLGSKMIFIHIPFYKNISGPKQFFSRVLAAIENVCDLS